MNNFDNSQVDSNEQNYKTATDSSNQHNRKTAIAKYPTTLRRNGTTGQEPPDVDAPR